MTKTTEHKNDDKRHGEVSASNAFVMLLHGVARSYIGWMRPDDSGSEPRDIFENWVDSLLEYHDERIILVYQKMFSGDLTPDEARVEIDKIFNVAT